jgi:uncharacterized membrane protein
MKHRVNAAAITAVLALAVDFTGCKASDGASPPTIPGVTFFGDEDHRAQIVQLSADGRAAVGESSDADAPTPEAKGQKRWHGAHGFYWTRSGAVQPVQTRDGRDVEMKAISGDGSTAVGCFNDAAKVSHAFRWTATGGVEDLGGPPGACATAVSRDGSVILGRLGYNAGFRWTRETGVQDLHVPGQIVSASADGATAVGFFWVGPDQKTDHVFLWTLKGGFEDLGAPPNVGKDANDAVYPEGMSADGSTIVGQYDAPDYKGFAFRWTRASGFRDLQGMPATAYSTSADGTQIVGESGSLFQRVHAVRWVGDGPPEAVGPPELEAALASSISADGHTIAGRAGADMSRWRAFVLEVK